MTLAINTTAYRSPNFNDRPTGVKPNAIVLHTTEGLWTSDIKWLCNPQTSGQYEPVSCHYVISPSGVVYQIVDDAKRAWHAGTGSYLGITDWNNASIGIEVSRKAGQVWTPAQYDALGDLCRMLIAKYDIPQAKIAAHRWIAPQRRSDPTNWADDKLKAWIAGLYAPTPTVGLTIRHTPRISRTLFRQVLEKGTALGPSPVTNTDQCYQIIVDNGLDPACLLAIFAHESQYGNDGVAKETKSWGNVRAPFNPSRAIGLHPRNFAIYADWQTGLLDLCERLNVRYIKERKLDTIQKIIPVYAPSSDGNAPQKYIDHVVSLVAQWEKESAVSDVESAWGTAAPFVRGHGIPDAYEREYSEGRDPGPILGPEKDADGWTVQAAPKALFIYKDGVTSVVRR